MVFKNSVDLYKKALNLIPGGVNSPVRAFKSVNREAPIFVKKGQGAKIYDEDNNEYIDYYFPKKKIENQSSSFFASPESYNLPAFISIII